MKLSVLIVLLMNLGLVVPAMASNAKKENAIRECKEQGLEGRKLKSCVKSKIKEARKKK